MTKRTYTGSTDARGNVRRMGTLKFMDYCTFLFGVQSIGIYSDRGMRSDPSKKSVHATWRAIDLKGTKDQRKALNEFLVAHADLLGIEEIHSYDGTGVPLKCEKWGAGWRCDRDAWKVWTAKANGGTPGADWTHVEIDPAHADSVALVDQAFAQIFKQ